MAGRIHAVQVKAITVTFAEDGDFLEVPVTKYGFRVPVSGTSATEIRYAMQRAADDLATRIIEGAGL